MVNRSRMRNSYIAHVCPNCKIIQGDYYVVEDNHQKTNLINTFQGLACKNCGHWEPVKVTKTVYKVETIVREAVNIIQKR